jgi:hypothetical protein
VLARDRVTGRDLRVEPAAAFVFVGLDPNTAFLRGVVELDDRGFIVTDDRFEISLPSSPRCRKVGRPGPGGLQRDVLSTERRPRRHECRARRGPV